MKSDQIYSPEVLGVALQGYEMFLSTIIWELILKLSGK